MKGSDFRAIREQIGFRQHEMADALDVSRETIVHWENRNGGQWEVPYVVAETVDRLLSNSGKIDAIKRARPPRKKTPISQKSAERLERIRAAGRGHE